jgi:hypothetical protein
MTGDVVEVGALTAAQIMGVAAAVVAIDAYVLARGEAGTREATGAEATSPAALARKGSTCALSVGMGSLACVRIWYVAEAP